ncbi:RNA polymerase II transcription regulator recruiting protein [Aureococcus anophagefferens]|nr:RNA polymerase II transcription regulator recruiting protein [Aureococcus anophagefferens]
MRSLRMTRAISASQPCTTPTRAFSGYKGFGSFHSEDVEELVAQACAPGWQAPSAPPLVAAAAASPIADDMRANFLLDDAWTFVNHGAFARRSAPLDVADIGADYFCGNLHKWYCSPRGSGFLWVRDRESVVEPLVVSHGYGRGFASDFIWTGAGDYGAPAAAGVGGLVGAVRPGTASAARRAGDSSAVAELVQVAVADEQGDAVPAVAVAQRAAEAVDRGKWSDEEDKRLLQIVEENGAKKWKRVAELLGSVRTDIQCLHRWTKVIKPGLNKGPWSAEEDEVVKSNVMKMQSESNEGVVKWAEIAKILKGAWASSAASAQKRRQDTSHWDEVVSFDGGRRAAPAETPETRPPGSRWRPSSSSAREIRRGARGLYDDDDDDDDVAPTYRSPSSAQRRVDRAPEPTSDDDEDAVARLKTEAVELKRAGKYAAALAKLYEAKDDELATRDDGPTVEEKAPDDAWSYQEKPAPPPAAAVESSGRAAAAATASTRP